DEAALRDAWTSGADEAARYEASDAKHEAYRTARALNDAYDSMRESLWSARLAEWEPPQKVCRNCYVPTRAGENFCSDRCKRDAHVSLQKPLGDDDSGFVVRCNWCNRVFFDLADHWIDDCHDLDYCRLACAAADDVANDLELYSNVDWTAVRVIDEPP